MEQESNKYLHIFYIMKYNQYLKLFISLVTLSASVLGIIHLQKGNLKKAEIVRDKETYLKEQEQFSTTAKIQKNIPSLGFNNLIADWTFLQFIQYFGDGEARQVTGYSTVTDYFEDIVNRDPNFMQSHLVMSSANSLFAARPQKTVALMNQAVEKVDLKVPNYPFLLWSYKAADETLFLGDLKAAENSYEKAAQWAKEWTKIHNDNTGNAMAKRYERSAAFLATNPDPTQAQIGAWMSILSTAQDRKTANYIVKQLEDLGVEFSISNDGQLIVKPPKDV